MHPDQNALATLTSVSTEVEADLIVGMLNEHGIAAVATGGYTSQFQAQAPGTVQVLVNQENLSAARSLLARRRPARAAIRYPGKQSSSPASDSSDEDEQKSVGADRDLVELGESPWSPPQFSLGSLVIAVTAFCFVCSMIKGLHLNWALGFYGAATFGMFAWLVIGLIRLVRCSEVVVPLKAKPLPRSPAEYAHPYEALDAAREPRLAGRLGCSDRILRGRGAVSWPEHEAYVRGCIQRVEEKQSRL